MSVLEVWVPPLTYYRRNISDFTIYKNRTNIIWDYLKKHYENIDEINNKKHKLMYMEHDLNSLIKHKPNLTIAIKIKKKHTWILSNVTFFTNTKKREKGRKCEKITYIFKIKFIRKLFTSTKDFAKVKIVS